MTFSRASRAAISSALLLALVGCGQSGNSEGSQGQAGPGTRTDQPGISPISAKLAQTFVLPFGCGRLVKVSGGLLGECYPQQNVEFPKPEAVLISEAGQVTVLPNTVALYPPWFPTNDGDVIASGTVNAIDAQGKVIDGLRQLLVVDPSSGTVKKAIPLPYDSFAIVGVRDATVLIRGSTGQDNAVQHVAAYDLGGAKRWDVELPTDTLQPVVELAGETVLLALQAQGSLIAGASGAGGGASFAVSAMRLTDGSQLWQSDANGLPDSGQDPPPSNFGSEVFYDLGGRAWSIATGQEVGPGLAPPGPERNVADPFRAYRAAVYRDDIVLAGTPALQRARSNGERVWSLDSPQLSGGHVASDGTFLLVLSERDGALASLDPTTGKILDQVVVPDIPQRSVTAGTPQGLCMPTAQLFVPLVVVRSDCVKSRTFVYRIE